MSCCLAAGFGLFLIGQSVFAAADSNSVDSDADGYIDTEEIAHNYSPFSAEAVKADKSDLDSDGLSDYWEYQFKTDPAKADTDGDGYSDFKEIDGGFDPLSTSTKKLSRRIEINLKKQTLTYYVADQPWKKFSVSTGKASMPTPAGKYKIINKVPKAWSKAYQLWMPYWMGLGTGSFGIHELPLWPSGYREGESHLGKPVSHGCVRLGIGPAKYLYERVDVGTEVNIIRQ
jgi:lipoprotein-anchoring transpeptidase ErfK/SrfK